MKKYVMLYAFTAVTVALILLAGHSVESTMVRVTAVRVTETTVEDTVTCAGKVEDYPGNSIYAVRPGIVRKIYVKVGDTVSAGQPIMDIVPSSSTSSDSTFPSSSSSTDYGAAYQAYTKYLQMQSNQTSSSGVTSAAASSSPDSAVTSDGTDAYTLEAVNSGTVKSLGVSYIGAFIGATSPAAVIQNGNGMRVRLSVDESQIADLKKGQKVQISGVGFKNSVYSGSIVSISSQAKQMLLTTGQETVVEVVASIDHPGEDIKTGFSAKAKITTSSNNRVLCVPYEAVQEDADGHEFVFCDVSGKAKKVPIITGREFDAGFEVKSGVKANDIVIMNPNDVTDGGKVVLVKLAAGDNA